MELKRTFYDYLLQWKAEKSRQCLLVNGARQIGKTFIIEKFGRENYESFIEINFALEPECKSIFEGAIQASGWQSARTANAAVALISTLVWVVSATART